MATLTQIRTDIATRLGQIDGLNCYSRIPDMLEAPAAVVGMPDPVEYGVTFGPTGATWTIPVRLYVSRFDAENAQDIVDEFIAPTGDSSVKQAVEDETVTITSGWHAVNVASAQEFGAYRVGDIDYLGCEFTVEVIAT